MPGSDSRLRTAPLELRGSTPRSQSKWPVCHRIRRSRRHCSRQPRNRTPMRPMRRWPPPTTRGGESTAPRGKGRGKFFLAGQAQRSTAAEVIAAESTELAVVVIRLQIGADPTAALEVFGAATRRRALARQTVARARKAPWTLRVRPAALPIGAGDSALAAVVRIVLRHAQLRKGLSLFLPGRRADVGEAHRAAVLIGVAVVVVMACTLGRLCRVTDLANAVAAPRLREDWVVASASARARATALTVYACECASDTARAAMVFVVVEGGTEPATTALAGRARGLIWFRAARLATVLPDALRHLTSSFVAAVQRSARKERQPRARTHRQGEDATPPPLAC